MNNRNNNKDKNPVKRFNKINNHSFIDETINKSKIVSKSIVVGVVLGFAYAVMALDIIGRYKKMFVNLSPDNLKKQIASDKGTLVDGVINHAL